LSTVACDIAFLFEVAPSRVVGGATSKYRTDVSGPTAWCHCQPRPANRPRRQRFAKPRFRIQWIANATLIYDQSVSGTYFQHSSHISLVRTAINGRQPGKSQGSSDAAEFFAGDRPPLHELGGFGSLWKIDPGDHQEQLHVESPIQNRPNVAEVPLDRVFGQLLLAQLRLEAA
jgi:hypothetical protein